MTDPRPPIRPSDDDWPETSDYHREQADEIARLREALRVALEALEPFARCAELDIGDGEQDDDMFRPILYNHAPEVTVGHFRLARAALRVALEDAAKVAEKNAEQCGPLYGDGFPAIECRVVERRIRALIPKEGEG